MRTHHCILMFVVFSLVALASQEVSAQENTPQACSDRVDNDADGYVDCGDQDCSYMNFCAQGMTTSTSAQLSAGWALPGAIVGFVAAPIVLGLAVGAEVTNGQDVAPNVLGGLALLVGISLAPVTAVSAMSARRIGGVRGCPACRITGWISYGLSIVDGATLLGLGLGAHINAPPGLITSVGLLGSISFCLLAADALVSRRQALRRPTADVTPQRQWSLAPFVAPIGDELGVTGAVAGVTLVTM